MADTSVKFLHSGMTAASPPSLSGTAGGLLGLLDACLVSGFGLKSVDSLVIASGVATGTVSSGQPFEVGTVALISGASVTGGSVNGEQKVTFTDTNTFKFDCPGLADQTATGTITAKVAPLGWSNSDVAAGTNIKAYRAPDVAGSRFFLRVDDTGAQEARLVGYETMSDINTGTGPFPTAAQVSGGKWFAKSNAADASAREWTLVGDGKRFYLCVRPATANARFTMMFGDFISRKSPDAFRCHLIAPDATYAASGTNNNATTDVGYCSPDAGSANGYSARGVSGLGASLPARRITTFLSTSGVWSGWPQASLMGLYPNTADNGLLLSRIDLWETSPNICARGQLAGVYFSPQAIGASEFAHRGTVEGSSGLPGKVLRALVGAGVQNAGPLWVDTTGPWE